MTASRNTIMNALLALAGTAIDAKGDLYFKTITRRFYNWQDDPAATRVDLPMLILWETPDAENYERTGRGLPPIRTWEPMLLLYDKIPDGETPGVPDSTTPGSQIVDSMLDAVELVIQPEDKDGLLTLGGLVIDCRIEGRPVKAFGDVDPSGICAARLPIKILVQ